MHLSLLGKGRLGRSLSVLIPRAGHAVTLCGRGDPIPSDTHAVLLCVPDGAIPEASQGLHVDVPVLHCSGSVSTDVVAHAPRGRFHPLMTFPGPEVALPDLTGVPAAIDGDPPAIEVAEMLARDLRMRSIRVPGDQRLYHCAAVMAGNFATVLLAEAAQVLTAAGIPAEDAASLLAPLALQSLKNAAGNPAAALTGPIARGDTTVIAAHRAALDHAGLDAQRDLYDRMTEHAIRLKRELS